MPFAEVTGHDRIVEVLRRSLRTGKTAHAYLFEGPAGCGRRTTALALIQALFCASAADDACGVCPSCRKVAAGNHGDIQFIEPLPDKRDISIEQLRALQRDLALRPYEAPRKVCVIEPADRMSVNAANSLLKTLEEPPGNALIILLSENAGMLLPTIRSRCQIIRFGALSPEHVQAILEQSGVAAESAALMAGLANGSMAQALELDNQELAARRDLVLERVAALDINRIATIFDASEQLSGNRDETLGTLDLLISFFRDALLLAGGSTEILNGTCRPQIAAVAERHTLPRLLELLEEVCTTRRAVQRNANPKLACDTLFMKLAARA